MEPIADPRRGDVEDDASSTMSRSLLSLAGSLLVEISLPKLIMTWALLLVVPSLALGLAPMVASAWIAAASGGLVPSYYAGVGPVLVLAVVVGLAWLLGGRLFRLAESSFWSLNALAVEPVYMLCREVLRHLAEIGAQRRDAPERVARLRAVTALAAGGLVSAAAAAVLLLAWPATRWVGTLADLAAPSALAWVALANAVVLVSAYLVVAALAWAVADATMPQPRDIAGFVEGAGGRVWRVAHLSDIHVVGERYGFRIESGRAGPCGNGRLDRAFARLAAIDAQERLDAVLITGDITDAGRSAEWAEFFEALAAWPQLAPRVLILPGNHDLNIVDRANPARLDLPTSPNRRLRQVRALSAMAALQGGRVQVVDRAGKRLAGSLDQALAPHRADLAAFADSGRARLRRRIPDLWDAAFPMVVPPESEDGLGILLMNSGTDTHFSFTNALGLMSAGQVRGLEIAVGLYPSAVWLVGLHHHLVEYPRAAKALSERIGTALINGNWFVRRLRPLAGRAVLMHGHRHIDWVGECAGLPIVSAPSPVMAPADDAQSYFYIQRLARGRDGRLGLLAPQRVSLAEDAAEPAAVTSRGSR